MKSTPQRSLTLKRMAAWIIQLTVTKIKYLTISAIPILVRPCAKSLIADSDLLIRLFNLALWEFIRADDIPTVLFFCLFCLLSFDSCFIDLPVIAFESALFNINSSSLMYRWKRLSCFDVITSYFL
jgi:hypothetical protein